MSLFFFLVAQTLLGWQLVKTNAAAMNATKGRIKVRFMGMFLLLVNKEMRIILKRLSLIFHGSSYLLPHRHSWLWLRAHPSPVFSYWPSRVWNPLIRLPNLFLLLLQVRPGMFLRNCQALLNYWYHGA